MKVDAYGMPLAQGLYDPWYEKAACGVGYVVSIDGTKSHKVCNFLVKNEWNDRNKKKPRWYPRGIQKLVCTYNLPDSGPVCVCVWGVLWSHN